MAVDPANCKLVDARMCEYGETWVCDLEVVDVNKEKTVNEIYAQFGSGFEPWLIHTWAQQAPDRLPKRGERDGKVLYRVGDVLAYQALLR